MISTPVLRHRSSTVGKSNRWAIFREMDTVTPHIYIKLDYSGKSPHPPTLTIHRKAGVCLIIWSKISELKVEARGREGRGHGGGREVVRHDLPQVWKSQTPRSSISALARWRWKTHNKFTVHP